MRTIKLRAVFSIGIILGLSQPLFSQEDILKEFAEPRNETKFCLYPSTLRMVNVGQNESFNELVRPVQKLLIYLLDSASRTSQDYLQMIDSYRAAGFEEYASMYGGSTTFYILGSVQGTNEMVGIFGEQDLFIAFYLKGAIAWQKIPELVRTIDREGMLNIFELNPQNWDD